MNVGSVIQQMMSPAGELAEPPRLTFPLPKDFVLPDGLKAGDIFNATGSFRVDEAGLMELVQVNGIPVDPTQTPESSEGDPNPSAPQALGSDGMTNQVTPYGQRGAMPRNMLNFTFADRMRMRR